MTHLASQLPVPNLDPSKFHYSSISTVRNMWSNLNEITELSNGERMQGTQFREAGMMFSGRAEGQLLPVSTVTTGEWKKKESIGMRRRRNKKKPAHQLDELPDRAQTGHHVDDHDRTWKTEGEAARTDIVTAPPSRQFRQKAAGKTPGVGVTDRRPGKTEVIMSCIR